MTTRTFKGRSWTLARCCTCGQHFTSPPPSDEEIASFYAGDYHANLRADGGTEREFAAKYERYADALARHLTLGKVVDVGCSTGLLVKMLRDRGYDAEGTEYNDNSAAYGRTHYGVTIHNGPLESAGYAPESLDAILMTDVLEHTRHPRDFLREAGKLIRPGGFALITFPDIRSIESRYQRALSKLLKRDWLWANCHVPLHVWEFTPRTATRCFEDAGFEVAEFRRHQPPAESLDSTALKLLMLPTRILNAPWVGRQLGTQMEFVIRKLDRKRP